MLSRHWFQPVTNNNNSKGIDMETAYSPHMPSVRYGLLATLCWSCVIAFGFILTQSFAAGIYIGMHYGRVSSAKFSGLVHSLQFNGMLLALCTFMTLVVCSTMMLVIVKLKKGASFREYIGWRLPDRRTAKRWALVFAAFLAATDLFTLAIGKPVVTEFMTTAYLTATVPWLMFAAIIVAAPFYEELFFRGFLLSGLERSMLGPMGAICVTAALWASIHVQYDWYGIATIFLMGLLLGWVRLRSGSLLLTIALHSFGNLVASVETVMSLHG